MAYCIDDAQMQELHLAEGQTLFDLDVSFLQRGIHTLTYFVEDERGNRSAPITRYFLIPTLPQGGDKIVAYEYWFNRGARRRIEVVPAVTVDSSFVVEVADVVPNTLSSYRFDVKSEQAVVDDEVSFGMQAFDGAGHASLGVMIDTFAMAVPVDLQMLRVDGGESLSVDVPSAGHMQGLKTNAQVGDSLVFEVSEQNVKADFYDSDGNSLTAQRSVNQEGAAIYSLYAKTAETYALLYDAATVRRSMTVSVGRHVPNLVEGVKAAAVELGRYNVNGQRIGREQRGVNIVRMSDGTVRKMIVR